jgi:hypothetical protein
MITNSPFPSTNPHSGHINLSFLILLFGAFGRYERDGIMSDVLRWLNNAIVAGLARLSVRYGTLVARGATRSESQKAETADACTRGFCQRPPYFHTNIVAKTWSLHNRTVHKRFVSSGVQSAQPLSRIPETHTCGYLCSPEQAAVPYSSINSRYRMRFSDRRLAYHRLILLARAVHVLVLFQASLCPTLSRSAKLYQRS